MGVVVYGVYTRFRVLSIIQFSVAVIVRIERNAFQMFAVSRVYLKLFADGIGNADPAFFRKRDV